jgi:hypothetical protein
MASDGSCASASDAAVTMNPASPSKFMRYMWTTQRWNQEEDLRPRVKPSGPCLSERTAARDAKRATTTGGRQLCLLTQLRPTRWTTAPMELNLDVLELIAGVLMRTGDARTLRALAVVNRECAVAVRNTLRAACDELRGRAEALGEAQDHRRLLGYDDEGAMSEAQLARVDAAETRRRATLDAYEDCMLETGIPEGRARALARKPWSRWFHGSTSLLGHLQNGCELCSSNDSSPQNSVRDTGCRAGPVSLFACRTCAHKHRVRFLLVKDWTDRTFHHPNGHAQRLTARFPSDESEANSYACALMSKRESHRRWMGGSHIHKARRTVPLSRRVYTNQPWTFELQDCWQLWSDESGGPMSDTDEMQFELWHELPPSIPAHLTFASIMKLGSAGEGARAQAASHSAARRTLRASTDARRAAFNRVALTHAALVSRVNGLVQGRGFRAWMQVVYLCCAARAFELRWLFRAEDSRFGDWRRARYKLLDMDPAVLVEAAHRVNSAACVMGSVLRGLRHRTTASMHEGARACVLEILKHLPTACLSPGLEHQLLNKVQHLREAPLRLSLVEDAAMPKPINMQLRVEVEIDPRLLGRASLELRVVVTCYTISKLRKLADAPDDGRPLTHEIVARIQDRANNWSHTERQDEARADLYGLPGAWPCMFTWDRIDNSHS